MRIDMNVAHSDIAAAAVCLNLTPGDLRPSSVW